MRKILCWFGFHLWVHWDGKSEFYRICEQCKTEEYTRSVFDFYRRIEPGMMFYRDPDWILDQPDVY